MNTRLLLALAALALPACGGGGGTTPAPVSAASAPAATPTAAPSGLVSASPTPSATPTHAATASPPASPTATPVPLALKVIGGAPLTATASQLSNARRNGQAHTLAQGVTNGIPILVESSGMAAAWAGDFVNWVTNAANGQDVPQTSGTITTTNNLILNNPGFSQACIGSLAAACIVHPTAWEYGTSSANGKPVGKQTLTIAFGDGTTGQTFDYVFDGWVLPCNGGWSYVNGVPVAQTTKVASDVFADCVNGNIVFPKGAMLAMNAAQDQYGRTETALPTLTAAIFLSSMVVNVPMASIAPGQIYGVATQDGGTAKVYFAGGASPTTVNSATGMSLHANTDGTYAF